MARKFTTGRQSKSGCFFLLTTGLVLIGLLVLNSKFVDIFFGDNYLGVQRQIFGAIQFVLPVIMVFIELWIYDAAVDFFRYRTIDHLKDDDS